MARLKTLSQRLPTIGSRIATMQPDSWRADKQGSTARGYGYKWQQARKRFLAEHPFCAYCLREAGITATDKIEIGLQALAKGLPFASVVDHKIPHRGDMTLFWDKSNWQSLCTTHHSRDKQREEASSSNRQCAPQHR